MGTILIKPDKSEDFYIQWSTETDRPIGYGTRQEWMNYDPKKFPETRMDWTDEHGCSSRIGEKWWDVDEILIHNVTKQLRTVKRTEFAAFIQEYFDAFPDYWPKFTPPKAARAVLKKYGTPFDYED